MRAGEAGEEGRVQPRRDDGEGQRRMTTGGDRRDVIFAAFGLKKINMLQTRGSASTTNSASLGCARAHAHAEMFFTYRVRPSKRSVPFFVFSRSSLSALFRFRPLCPLPPALPEHARARASPRTLQGRRHCFCFWKGEEKKRGAGGPEAQRRKSAAPQKKTRGRLQRKGEERETTARAHAKPHARPPSSLPPLPRETAHMQP